MPRSFPSLYKSLPPAYTKIVYWKVSRHGLLNFTVVVTKSGCNQMAPFPFGNNAIWWCIKSDTTLRNLFFFFFIILQTQPHPINLYNRISHSTPTKIVLPKDLNTLTSPHLITTSSYQQCIPPLSSSHSSPSSTPHPVHHHTHNSTLSTTSPASEHHHLWLPPLPRNA